MIVLRKPHVDWMPKYFFNIQGEFTSKDLIGAELSDLDSAKREALKDIAEIKRARFETIGNDWSIYSMEICDHDHNVLLIVPFTHHSQ